MKVDKITNNNVKKRKERKAEYDKMEIDTHSTKNR